MLACGGHRAAEQPVAGAPEGSEPGATGEQVYPQILKLPELNSYQVKLVITVASR